jgi:predicted phage baseplate assembly protein
MSDDDVRTLDDCGCCGSDDGTIGVHNASGLSALGYRVGTFQQFRDRMLRSLSSMRSSTDSQHRPLEQLTVRTADDPTVALIDAFAQVADVLTFYQERIANEGFLRTATERRSVLELARAIGYELSPGVAASVHLSFTVEEAPGAPRRSFIAKCTQVQSVPAQGKPPQVFETSSDFTALAEWNRLRPRLTRPADVAILISEAGAEDKLVLLVPSGSAPAEDVAASAVTAAQVRRLSGKDLGVEGLDAVEVSRIYLTDAASTVAKGDLLLFAGGTAGDRHTVLRKVTGVLAEPERKRIRVDIESLTAPTPARKPLHYRFVPIVSLATVKLAALPFTGSTVSSTIGSAAWRERDLSALIGIQAWSRTELATVVNAAPSAPAPPPQSGAFAFREKLGFFGNNAPKWSALPESDTTNGTPYADAWDAGDDNGTPLTSRTIWTDSQGTPNRNDNVDAYLERAVNGVVPGSWVVIGSKSVKHRAWAVHNTTEISRADFAISSRTTALRLADPSTGQELTSAPVSSDYLFREATAYVGSNAVAFADLPIETPVDAGTVALELDNMVLGLAPGQSIALTGVRWDAPGVQAAEIAVLTDVIHASGHTVLVLATGLKFSYVRDQLFICANVVHATHGETVREVLGGGDASKRNQRFMLSKPPLTYVSTPTPAGSQSTLEVRINDVLWEEVPSLLAVPPEEPAYVVRIDDDARASVTFGDGIFGARTPTGSANIKVQYRSGIGADGEVDAGSLTIIRTMPLGVRGVTNVLAANGAEDPEKLSQARHNAPLTALTFERVVSLIDFEDFARTFPGIGKALRDELWVDGAALIHVTVASATGGPASSDVVANLYAAIAAASDGSQRFLVSSYAQRFFKCKASVAVDKRYRTDLVLAAVTDHTRAMFSFDARSFGQPVTPAEVITRMHEIEGVVAVDLNELAAYSDAGDSAGTSLAGLAPLAAQHARWDDANRTPIAAELLLVNPVGIDITEMIL